MGLSADAPTPLTDFQLNELRQTFGAQW